MIGKKEEREEVVIRLGVALWRLQARQRKIKKQLLEGGRGEEEEQVKGWGGWGEVSAEIIVLQWWCSRKRCGFRYETEMEARREEETEIERERDVWGRNALEDLNKERARSCVCVCV